MSPTDPPAGPPPEETPARPVADPQSIAREIDRLTRRVQDMSERMGWSDELREMWKLLRQLADGVTALSAPAAREGSQAWLLQVGEEPETLVERLTDLVGWLDAVYLRYPGTELPSCWMSHPWVVEELLWLRGYHAQAYGPQGGPVPQGMWHDQSLPRLAERIRKEIGTCDLSKHVSAGQADKAPLAAPLAGHIQAVAEAWSSTGLPPEPSAEQLADALAYDDVLSSRS
jgi:hypothetical protein